MSYVLVDQIIRQAIEDLVSVGASRASVERHIRPLEVAAVASIAESQRDQLLLDFDYRSADLAERFGVDERTIRKWRKTALDRNSEAVTGSVKAA